MDPDGIMLTSLQKETHEACCISLCYKGYKEKEAVCIGERSLCQELNLPH